MPLKQFFARSYFYRLYQANKILFVFIALFFSLSVFANLIRLETTPFFVWNMYSEAIQDSPVDVIEIRYNQGMLLNIAQTWKEPGKILLTQPLFFFLKMQQMNQHDSFELYMKGNWLKRHPAWTPVVSPLYNSNRDLSGFPDWYRQKLSQWVGVPVDSVYAIRRKIGFGADGKCLELSADTVFIINNNYGRKTKADH